MDINELYKYVELFHNMILEIKNDLSPEFQNFPNGSCGTTSILLGTFLNKTGFGNFKMKIGEKGFWENNIWQEYSHAWLESNHL